MKTEDLYQAIGNAKSEFLEECDSLDFTGIAKSGLYIAKSFGIICIIAVAAFILFLALK